MSREHQGHSEGKRKTILNIEASLKNLVILMLSSLWRKQDLLEQTQALRTTSVLIM